MATEDNIYYTPKEVEYLDKYGLLSENLLDDEQIYELVIKHNFNDERILNDVNLAVAEIKSRGEDYMWGDVENGKKKLHKEAELKEKTEQKDKKQHKKQHPNKHHQAQKHYKQNKNHDVAQHELTGTQLEKDSQFRALHEENMINYNYYNRGSYGRGKNFRARGNRQYYNSTNDHYNQQGYYNKRGRGGYQKANQEKQADNDIQFEYNDEGKLVYKSSKTNQEPKTEETTQHIKEEDSHDVIIKEIAQSQANMHKHETQTVETKAKPLTPVKAKQPSPVKPKEKTPIKDITPEVPKQEEKQKSSYITTSENDFHIKSVEESKPQPQQKSIQNTQPSQPFDPSQGMQGGMPNPFPMFPFPMYDPEMMKNMYANMQMPNMPDPKNPMNSYYAMMNHMYMQQMMFYKNMMSQQMGGDMNEQFNNMMFGKK